MSHKLNIDLSKPIIGSEERDAVHIAVEPVIAGETLKPGQHIGVKLGVAKSTFRPYVGVVSPFMKKDVKTEETFWMLVYPNTITSLRHDWEHPNIPKHKINQDVQKSKKWIEEYCDDLGLSYSDLIFHATNFIKTGEYWNGGSEFEGMYLHDDFWYHYEIITGTKVKEDDKTSFLTCSC